MEVLIKDGEFTIKGKLSQSQPSGTGKTETLFTTHGLQWQDGGIYVNLTIGKKIVTKQ